EDVRPGGSAGRWPLCPPVGARSPLALEAWRCPSSATATSSWDVGVPPGAPGDGLGGNRDPAFLVFQTDADIRALFMGIDDLCRKYSKETFQVSEFQEKHRRRLLAFYREKISKLEESLRKSVLRLEQLQGMRLSQQTAFNTIKTPVSTPWARPGGHLRPPDSSASNRVESMQVDLTPSPARKSEVTAGPARISLISPPHDGRMEGNPVEPTQGSAVLPRSQRGQ
uniref:probable E3 SUMO-protein ligase RNF212 n=1 Tax=Panthera onca TaxID=9690 RepID=UPI002952E944